MSSRKREENEQLFFGVDRQLLRKFDVLAVSVAPWSEIGTSVGGFWAAHGENVTLRSYTGRCEELGLKSGLFGCFYRFLLSFVTLGLVFVTLVETSTNKALLGLTA